MIKQCAWCKNLMIDGIRLDGEKDIISGMSHGICRICKEKLKTQINLSHELKYAVPVNNN